MGDGRQQPENGKGLGFEASARSERRFKTRSRRTDSRGAPRLAPYRVVLLAHSCGFALAAFRGRGTGRDETAINVYGFVSNSLLCSLPS